MFVRARRGEFDGIVAMYHDQGHIALKLLGGLHAVNITAGLPLVRTSVAHGTAYDIAGRGIADATSLIEAVRVAAQLAASGRRGEEAPMRTMIYLIRHGATEANLATPAAPAGPRTIRRSPTSAFARPN